MEGLYRLGYMTKVTFHVSSWWPSIYCQNRPMCVNLECRTLVSFNRSDFWACVVAISCRAVMLFNMFEFLNTFSSSKFDVFYFADIKDSPQGWQRLFRGAHCKHLPAKQPATRGNQRLWNAIISYLSGAGIGFFADEVEGLGVRQLLCSFISALNIFWIKFQKNLNLFVFVVVDCEFTATHISEQ